MEPERSGIGTAGFLLAGGVAAIGALALGVPLGAVFAIGLFLLCPLMMMGMHGGHGHGRRSDPIVGDEDSKSPRSNRPRR